jgi:hypothetical protein
MEEEQLDPISGLVLPDKPTTIGEGIPTYEGNVEYKFGADYAGEFRTPDTAKDVGLLHGMNQDDFRAQNQSNWDLIPNTVFQIGTTVLADMVDMAGYLMTSNPVNPMNYYNAILGERNTLSKELASWSDEIREFGQDVTPIYGSTAAQTEFRPWDGEWWALNGPSIGSTLSLMAPGYGTGKLGFKLSKALTKGIAGEKWANRIGATAGGLSAGIVSRHLENLMESSEVLDTIYKEGLEAGKSAEEAQRIAAESAHKNYNLNYINLLTDIPQYMFTMFGIGGATKFGLKSFFSNFASEGLEEATQFVISKESEYFGRRKLDTVKESEFSQRMAEYITDPQLHTAAFFGGISGGVFAGLSSFVGNLKDAADKKIPIEKAQDNVLESLVEKALVNDNIDKQIEFLTQAKQDPSQLEQFGLDPQQAASKIDNAISDMEFVKNTYDTEVANGTKKDLARQITLNRLKERMSNRRIAEVDAEINTLSNNPEETEKIRRAVFEKLQDKHPDFKNKFEELKDVVQPLDTSIYDAQIKEITKKLGYFKQEAEQAKKVNKQANTPKGKKETQEQIELIKQKEKLEQLQAQVDKLTDPVQFEEAKENFKDNKDALSLVNNEIIRRAKEEQKNAEEKPTNVKELYDYYKDKPFTLYQDTGHTSMESLNQEGQVKDFRLNKIYQFTADDGVKLDYKFVGEKTRNGNKYLVFEHNGKTTELAKKFVDNNKDRFRETNKKSDPFTSQANPNRYAGETVIGPNFKTAPTDADLIKMGSLGNQAAKTKSNQNKKETNKPKKSSEELEEQMSAVEFKTEQRDEFIQTYDTAMMTVGQEGDVKLTNHNGPEIDLEAEPVFENGKYQYHKVTKQPTHYIVPSKIRIGNTYNIYDKNGDTIPSNYTNDFVDYDIDFIRELPKKASEYEVHLEVDNRVEWNTSKKAKADNVRIDVVVYDNGVRKTIGVLKTVKANSSQAFIELREDIFNASRGTKEVFQFDQTFKIKSTRGGRINNRKDKSKRTFASNLPGPNLMGVGYHIPGQKENIYLKTNEDQIDDKDIKDQLKRLDIGPEKILPGVVYRLVEDLSGKLIPIRLFTKTIKNSPEIKKKVMSYLAVVTPDSIAKLKSLVQFRINGSPIPDINDKMRAKFSKSFLTKKGDFRKIRNRTTQDLLKQGTIIGEYNAETDYYSVIYGITKVEDGNFTLQELNEDLSRKETEPMIVTQQDVLSFNIHHATMYYEYYDIGDAPVQVDSNKINVQKGYNNLVASDRLETDLSLDAPFVNPSFELDLSTYAQKKVQTKKESKEKPEAAQRTEVKLNPGEEAIYPDIINDGSKIIVVNSIPYSFATSQKLTKKQAEKLKRKIAKAKKTKWGFKVDDLQVVQKVHSPQINKDGKLEKAAKVTVFSFNSVEELEQAIDEALNERVEESPDIQNKIEEVKANKEFIKLSKDGTKYINTKTGKEYQRVSEFIEDPINIYAGTGENAHLSNFAKRPFKDGGINDIGSRYSEVTGKQIVWNTVEGAFQAEKLIYTYTNKNSKYWEPSPKFEDALQLSKEGIALVEKFANATGSQAKKLGRRIKGLDTKGWDRSSETIMYSFIRESFVQNPDALKRLLETGNAALTHTQDRGKWGKLFPKILMEVREELRKEKGDILDVGSGEVTNKAATSGKSVRAARRAAKNSSGFNKANKIDGAKFRKANTSLYQKLNKEEEKSWFEKRFNFPIQFISREEIMKLFPINTELWGAFTNAAIYVNEEGAMGTTYHEAFHLIFNLYLTDVQQQQLLDSTGIENKLLAEEKLAEDFREFVEIKNSEFKDINKLPFIKQLVPRVKRWFNKMYHLVKFIATNKVDIDTLYHLSNTRYFKNAKIQRDISNMKPKYSTSFNPTREYEILEHLTTALDYAIETYKKANPGKSYNKIFTDLLNPNSEENLVFSEEIPYSVINILEEQIETLEGDTSKEEELLDQIIEELGSFTLTDGVVTDIKIRPFFQKLLRSLNSRGYIVNIEKSISTETAVGREDEGIFEEIEEDRRESWQVKSLSVSPLEKLTKIIRHELSQIPVLEIENGSLVVQKGILDLPKPNRPGFVYMQLQPILGNSVSREHMEQKLVDASRYNPYAKWVHAMYADNNEFMGNLYLVIGQKNKPSFVTILQERVKKVVKTKVIPTNLNNKLNNLLQQNYSYLKTYSPLYNKKGEIQISEAKKFEDKVKEITGNKKVTEEVVEQYVGLLNEIGLNITLDQVNLALSDNRALMTKHILNKKVNTIYSFISDVAKGKDPIEENNDGLRNLLKVLLNTYENNLQNTHINPTGGKVYQWIDANFMGRTFNMLKEKELALDFIEGLQQDLFYQFSPLLNLIKNSYASFAEKSDIDYDIKAQDLDFTIISDMKMVDENRGTEYYDMSERQIYISLLGAFYNNNSESRIVPIPVPSNAPVMAGLKLIAPPTLETFEGKKGVFDYLKDALFQEVIRIKLDRSNIKNQNKYKDTFVYFDILETNTADKNKILKPSLEELLDDPGQIDEVLEKVVRDQYKKIYDLEMAKMKKLNIIKEVKKTGKYRFADNLLDNRPLESVMPLFVANFMLFQNQLGILLNGDISHYKTVANYFKRSKQVWSPGTYLDTLAEWAGRRVRATFNVKYLKDVKGTYQYEDILAALNMIVPEDRKADMLNTIEAFKRSDEADGQSFIDIYRYREIMIGLHRWSDNHQKVYDNLMKGNFDMRTPESIMNTLKPFYYGLHQISDDQITPVQKKDSEFIILPVYGLEKVNGKINPMYNPKYKEMLEDMGYTFTEDSFSFDEAGRDTGTYTDQFSFESAIKVGLFGESDKVKDALRHRFSNANWRLQQETPAHHQNDRVIYAVQVRKNLLANLDDEATYTDKNYTKEQFIEKYNELVIKEIEEAYNKIKDRFGSFEKFRDMLYDEVLSRNLGDQFIEALDVITLDDNTKQLKLPTYHPLHLYRIEALLNSIIKKKVTSTKLQNGAALINLSSYGFQRKPRILFNKDGTLDALEAYVPVYNTALYKYKDENGFIDIDKVPEELKQGMVWRIPNEDKYSIFKIKIIGFLPYESGGAIVLPPDITTIAGLDFDIDKVYGFFPSLQREYKDVDRMTELKGELKELRKELNVNQEEFQENIKLLQEYYSEYNTRYDNKGDLLQYINDNYTDIEDTIEIINNMSKSDLLKLNSIRYREIKKEFGKFEVFQPIKAILTDYNISIKDKYNNVDSYFRDLGSKSKNKQKIFDELTSLFRNFEITKVEPSLETKGGRDNLLLKYANAAMTTKRSTEAFLTPGGFDILKDNNTTINKAKGRKLDADNNVVEDSNIMSPSNWAEVADRFLTGDKLIGISANANAAHAIFQLVEDLKLNDYARFVFDGRIYNNLSQEFTERGNRISRNVAETLAAWVDNGNDPQAKYSNINNYTIDVALGMALTGIDLNTIQYFLSQPVIVDFVEEILNKGATMNAEREAINKYASKEYISPNLKKLSPSNFTTEWLEENLNNNTEFDRTLIENFLIYKKVSKSISNLVTAVKIGEQGTGPTDSHNLSRIDQYDDTERFKHIANPHKVLANIGLFTKKLVDVIRDGRKMIIDTAQLPDRNKGEFYNNRMYARDMIPERDLSIKEIEFINQNFVDYLASEHDMFKFDSNLLSTLPDRLLAYQKKKSDFGFFTNRLNVSEEDGRKYIYYTGYTGEDKLLRDQIRNTWKAMLTSPNNTEKQLAIDLVRYTFMTSGFRLTPVSFNHLMPVNFFTDIIPDFSMFIKEEFNKAEEADYNTDFFERFIKNHYRSLAYVPKVVFEDDYKNVSAIHFDDNKNATQIDIAVPDVFMTRNGMFVDYIKYYNSETKEYQLFKLNIQSVYYVKGRPISASYSPISTLGEYKSKGFPRGKIVTQWQDGRIKKAVKQVKPPKGAIRETPDDLKKALNEIDSCGPKFQSGPSSSGPRFKEFPTDNDLIKM